MSCLKLKKKAWWKLTCPCPETGCTEKDCGAIIREDPKWCPKCVEDDKFVKAWLKLAEKRQKQDAVKMPEQQDTEANNE